MLGSNKYLVIRQLYFYSVSIITLIVILASSIGLISLGLKEAFGVLDYEQISALDPYECSFQSNGKPVDPLFGNVDDIALSKEEKLKIQNDCIKKYVLKANQNHLNNVKRDLISYLSMLLISLPLYLIHWRIFRKESKK